MLFHQAVKKLEFNAKALRKLNFLKKGIITL